jgi:hypothetical protein
MLTTDTRRSSHTEKKHWVLGNRQKGSRLLAIRLCGRPNTAFCANAPCALRLPTTAHALPPQLARGALAILPLYAIALLPAEWSAPPQARQARQGPGKKSR